jgi:murein DD-endopeptidase MepM/ murein hydrolase activator NlpD
VPLTTMLVAKQAVITSSLFESAEAEGIPQDILFRMIKLLSYDVDFQRDIRKGDRFTLLFEQKQNKKGETLDSGDILYLSLELTKKTVTMYRFADRKGKAYFYNVEGKSIKKSLLTTPVDGYRISSGFGMRKHPVLGYNRMHKGMDFAAPRGTPIYAAGDGTIARIGRNGGYGNYIRINHGKGYATAYAHMRRFGRGMRSGKRVKQGSVIGYVGTTGRSTGPHLHYEVLVNGKQVNPHSIKTTPGSQLRGIRNGIFQRYLEQVDQLTRSLL